MAQSRNSLVSKLARNLDATGDITSGGIASTVSLGADVYDSIGELPYSGVNEGQTALIPGTGRFYVYSGQGWYNVAVINRTPTFTSVTDSDGGTTPFALSIEGVDTTITLVAGDSDGDPLTYSYVTDSGFDGLATITGSGTEYTITPFSSDSATTESGTITFRVNDGINTASSVNTFTLSFPLLTPDWSSDQVILYTDTTLTAQFASGYGHTFSTGEIIGDYYYVAVRDAGLNDAWVEIYDISSGIPTYHTKIGGVSSNTVWTYLYGMRLIGTRLYVLGHNAGIIGIDVSNPANPSIHREDYYTTGGLAGGYGALYYPYVDDANEDIYYKKTGTTILKSSLSNWWTNGGYWTETTVLTNYSLYSGDISPNSALLAAHDNNTTSVRIVTLSNNSEVSTISVGSQFPGVFFLDNTTLVIMGQNNTLGFKIYDLSTPASPSLIHSNTSVSRIGGNTTSFVYDQGGNRLAIGINNYGINVWDTSGGLSNPSLFAAGTDWNLHGQGLRAKGGYTYGVYNTTLRTWYN